MYPEENVTLNSRERFHARIQNSSGVSHGERVGVRRIFRFARGVCVWMGMCVSACVCVCEGKGGVGCCPSRIFEKLTM